MNDDISKTITYLFILGIVLLGFAYYAGANKLGGTFFSGINTLLLTSTGRDSSGAFAAYPTGGPTS